MHQSLNCWVIDQLITQTATGTLEHFPSVFREECRKGKPPLICFDEFVTTEFDLCQMDRNRVSCSELNEILQGLIDLMRDVVPVLNREMQCRETGLP